MALANYNFLGQSTFHYSFAGAKHSLSYINAKSDDNINNSLTVSKCHIFL